MVRTAVIPVAGWGTRMLPLTASVPKELLPVFDRTVLDRALQECVEAGVERVVLVTSPRKRETLSAHLNPPAKLAERLTPWPLRVCWAVQDPPRGLGHAVLQAAPWVDGPFAVILPDELLLGPSPLKAMFARQAGHGGAELLLREVPAEHSRRYGMARVDEAMRVLELVEKPEVPPGPWAVVGRYVLPAETMAVLAGTGPGAGGEIQLTDALVQAVQTGHCRATPLSIPYCDGGQPLGLLEAGLRAALARDPEGVRALLERVS